MINKFHFVDMKHSYIHYLVLVTFSFASIALYLLDKIAPFLFSFAITLGVYTYLFDNNKLIGANIHNNIHKGNTIKLCLNIAFVLLFAASVLSTSLYVYNKGLIYYLCIAFLAGFIFIDILILKDSEKNPIILFKTILLGLNIFLSNLLIFPYGVGASGDTYYQIYLMVIPITQSGHIPQDTGYYFFPIHQILVSISSQISSVEPGIAYFFMAAIVISIGTSFIFIMANKFINHQAGLISSLIYISSGYTLYNVSHPFQTTFAIPFVIMLVYLVFIDFYSNKINYRILFLIILITLIFTHAHSTGILFVIFFILFICEFFSNMIGSAKHNVLRNKISLFFAAMLSYWIFFALYFQNVVYTIDTYVKTFSSEAEYVSAIVSVPRLIIPLKLLILDKMYYLSLTLSTIGFFHSIKKTSIFHLFINLFSFIFISILIIGMFIKVPVLASGRLFTYLEALGFSFLSAYAIMHLIDLNKLFSKRNISMLVVIMVLFFFTTSSSISGIETSLYTKSKVAHDKKFDTPNERSAILWTNAHIKNSSEILISNNFIPYRYSQFENYEIKDASIDLANVTGKYIAFNDFDIISGTRVDFSEKYGSTIIKLNRSVSSDLDAHNKYYADGIIDIFYN